MAFRDRALALTNALQRRVVPELRYSQTQYEERLRSYVEGRGVGSWLDVGCGHQLLPAWRAAEEVELIRSCERVVGIDYDLDALRRHPNIRDVCRCDVAALPFGDASFDLVTANMVVEHLAEPATQFREIARVLRPGGVFLFHTPNARSYPTRVSRVLPDGFKKTLARVLEARASEDVFPTYYRANTAETIRDVATASGLEVEAVHFTGSVPVFAVAPPLAAVELLVLRQLMRRPELAKYRQTLIVALRRPGAAASNGSSRSAAAAGTR